MWTDREPGCAPNEQIIRDLESGENLCNRRPTLIKREMLNAVQEFMLACAMPPHEVDRVTRRHAELV